MSKRPSKPRQSATESGGDDDAFLSRWARRKRISKAGGDPDTAQEDARVDENVLASAVPDTGESTRPLSESEPEALTDEDMPPVDSIDENTDMSGFFSPKVSEAVKKAALKKFFHSPAFNIVDGLDDYDDDFTAFAALGDIVTSDMRGQMELKQRRAEEEALAKNEQAIESAPPPEEPSSGVEHEEAAPEPDDVDAVRAESNAVDSDESGITRDPARQVEAGPGKLRRRDSDGIDA